MSATSTRPSNREWLRRMLSGQPHQVIGGAANPYMLRWHVIPRNPLLNIYVHKFLRSDDDRALHDHPWWFVSLIIRSGYYEVTESGRRERAAGSIAFRPATWRHRVELFVKLEPEARGADWVRTHLVEQTCWTLIVTGPRRRTWGFWCKQPLRYPPHPLRTEVDIERFVPWTDFGDAGCGETS